MTFAQTLKHASLAAALIVTAATAAPVGLHAAEAEKHNVSSNFLPSTPAESKISFVRKQDAAADQFVLRVAFPTPTSGCARFENPSYQTSVEPTFLKISIDSPQLVRKNSPRHPEYECSGKASVPTADIYISKAQLQTNKLQKIVLEDKEYQQRKAFTVDMNDSFVEMFAETEHDEDMSIYKPQELRQKRESLKYWFYPENTAILYVPMAEHGKDLSSEIKAMAQRKGFTPLSEELQGFEKPVTTPNYFYYVTRSGMNISDRGSKIGTIKTTKTVYGLIGDETEVTALDVFAKTPGQYE